MTTKIVARCAIYPDRPKLCVDYPTAGHYTPPECTYTFVDGERFGECTCDVAACCRTPREMGMPGGTPLPELAGGAPCRYLTHVEEEIDEDPIKTASSLNRNDAIKGALGL